MGLLGNLAKIVAAPVTVVDKVIVEPLAELTDVALEEMGMKGED